MNHENQQSMERKERHRTPAYSKLRCKALVCLDGVSRVVGSDTNTELVLRNHYLEMIEKSGRKRRSPNNGWCNVWIAVDGFQYERA